MSDKIKETWDLVLKNRVHIHTLILVVGHACTLRCKDCANLCPYMPSSVASYNSEDILRDLKSVLRCTDQLNKFQIQGGEPFIYKDLDKVLAYVWEEPKIGYCIIATNGTVLPGAETLDILTHGKFEVRISHYEISNHKVKELTKMLNEHNIKNRMFTFDSLNDQWASMGRSQKRETDTRYVKKRFQDCAFRYCLTLENGKLGWCSRCISAPLVQGFTPRKNDYFIVSNISGKPKKKKLGKWLIKHKYMEACRFCYGTNDTDMVTPALQIERRETGG